ncbi:hypothetical protein [Staphylococcus caeli]|uniref:hypothetical protein n=1 Tax=Staphylococcus caeli TaxID=2201815 RepID=UPI003F57A026
MENTKFNLHHTDKALERIKKAFDFDDDLLDAIRNSVIEDIKANMSNKSSDGKKSIAQLAEENRLIK